MSQNATQQVYNNQRILVFGGDSYTRNAGGGQLYNKIWTTPGGIWQTYRNKVLKNKRGAFMPRIIIAPGMWTEGKPPPNPEGNSYCRYTEERCKELRAVGFHDVCKGGLDSEKECNKVRFGGLNTDDSLSVKVPGKGIYPGDCRVDEAKLANCLSVDPAAGSLDREWVPVNYRQWLHCASRPWVDGVEVKTCNFDKQVIGGSVTFSQRRNMATVSFANRVYVLGGRVRGHSQMQRRQCNKGRIFGTCETDADCPDDAVCNDLKCNEELSIKLPGKPKRIIEGQCGDGIVDIDRCLKSQLCLDWQGLPIDETECYRIRETCRRDLAIWREEVEYTNDIWVSVDGDEFKMVTPGCISPQKDLIGRLNGTFPGGSKYGQEARACQTDADCDIIYPNGVIYGTVEKCDTELGRCYCPMWSPREMHTAAIFPAEPTIPVDRKATGYIKKPLFSTQSEISDFVGEACPKAGPPQRIYVMGGHVHVSAHSCGKWACGDGYQHFMNDVWRSKKECSPAQRIVDPVGCNSADKAFGEEWELVVPHAPWRPRGSHGLVVFRNELWLMGGRTGNVRDAFFNDLLNDVWRCQYPCDGTDDWVQAKNAPWIPRANFNVHVVMDSYNETEVINLWGGLTANGVASDGWKFNGTSSANVSLTDNIDEGWVADFSNITLHRSYVTTDSPLSLMYSLTESEIKILNDHGIFTIKELATASKETILQLRGGGEGEGWQAYRGGPFRYVCPHKKLAESIVDLCDVVPEPFDEQFLDARAGLREIIYGLPPGKEPEYDEDEEDPDGCSPPELEPEEEALKDDEEKFEEKREAYILSQLLPDGELDRVCKYLPPKRAYAASTVLHNRMYIFGGYLGDNSFVNDVWYRDDELPITRIDKVPENETSDSIIEFSAENEPGCIFQYRMWRLSEDPKMQDWSELLRNWTFTTERVNYKNWSEFQWGGKFRFEVRAFDPAGNIDPKLEYKRNVIVFVYIPALPIPLILGSSGGFVFVLLCIFLEYRRRRKKAAMERYALKKMRRKFKGYKKKAKGKGPNWRKYMKK